MDNFQKFKLPIVQFARHLIGSSLLMSSVIFTSCNQGKNHIGTWVSLDGKRVMILKSDNTIAYTSGDSIVNNVSGRALQYSIDADKSLRPEPYSFDASKRSKPHILRCYIGEDTDSALLWIGSILFIHQQKIQLNIKVNDKEVSKDYLVKKEPESSSSSFTKLKHKLGKLLTGVIAPLNNPEGEEYSFGYGLLHGLFIIPAIILKLLGYEFGLYADNNNGWAYWIGFVLGLSIGRSSSRRY